MPTRGLSVVFKAVLVTSVPFDIDERRSSTLGLVYKLHRGKQSRDHAVMVGFRSDKTPLGFITFMEVAVTRHHRLRGLNKTFISHGLEAGKDPLPAFLLGPHIVEGGRGVERPQSCVFSSFYKGMNTIVT